MAPESPSLAGRAIIALVLTIGFYALGLAVAATLLFIPYAEFLYAHRLHLRLTIICIMSAGVILLSILPRRDRFQAPGPSLDEETQPGLFREAKDVAARVGQRMPDDVYLIPDVNAFVAERGGFIGIGRRRVMGLGLPLLQVLTVSQLRAVIVHEFAHFSGGDTRLGPWIYRTRSALVRTATGLGDSWIQAPFRWYAGLFLRVTNAISRREEFVADAVAARIVGAASFSDGLFAVHRTAPAFRAFWESEYTPLLHSGYIPDLTDGFRRFLEAPSIVSAMEEAASQENTDAPSHPCDSHPSLSERVSSVCSLSPAAADEVRAEPAIALLEDVPDLQRVMVKMLTAEDSAEALKPLEWPDVGRLVCLPQWEKMERAHAGRFAGLRLCDLPERLRARPSA